MIIVLTVRSMMINDHEADGDEKDYHDADDDEGDNKKILIH